MQTALRAICLALLAVASILAEPQRSEAASAAEIDRDANNTLHSFVNQVPGARELANKALESRDARLIVGQHVCGGRVAVEHTGLVLGKPDADQGAADLMPFGEPVKRLATQVILNDLPLELDRVVAVLGHGAFSSKARSG